jgi:hypothetical protein
MSGQAKAITERLQAPLLARIAEKTNDGRLPRCDGPVGGDRAPAARHRSASCSGPADDRTTRVTTRCSSCAQRSLNSDNPGYGVPSNRGLKSLVLVLRFLRFLLFSPQKATKRTKRKGIGSAWAHRRFSRSRFRFRLERGHFCPLRARTQHRSGQECPRSEKSEIRPVCVSSRSFWAFFLRSGSCGTAGITGKSAAGLRATSLPIRRPAANLPTVPE